MSKITKFKNNILSTRAITVLGPPLYFRYLYKFTTSLADIAKAGDLRPLDKIMGQYSKRFHYKNSTFIFDCEFCDTHLKEDSFAFGIAREIYIRDCYFKWLPPTVYENAKNVFDLGSNRGAFSALMTSKANFILSVECEEGYRPIIKHNFEYNNFHNYAIETIVLGTDGKITPSKQFYTISNLLSKYDLKTLDLVKLDIEGSEFSLFDDVEWLDKVNAITMEVHPDYGKTIHILNKLQQKLFSYEIADENLHLVTDPQKANFIYAWKIE